MNLPQFIHFLENEAATKITQVIVHNISRHLTNIMKKINLRQLVEDQINTFDLDYIEKLIIEIANKELKLIMSLGFLLGGNYWFLPRCNCNLCLKVTYMLKLFVSG